MVRFDLRPLFKVKRWFTGFGELPFRWIQICISSPIHRSSLFLGIKLLSVLKVNRKMDFHSRTGSMQQRTVLLLQKTQKTRSLFLSHYCEAIFINTKLYTYHTEKEYLIERRYICNLQRTCNAIPIQVYVLSLVLSQH